MKELIEAIFSYSRKEKRGLLVLMMLVLIVNAVNFSIPYIYPGRNAGIMLTSLDSLVYREITKTDSIKDDSQQYQKGYSDKSGSSEWELQEFDPNSIRKEEWLKLGISEKTAQTIINYRNKGGVFRNKEDLMKIYNFSSEEYNRIQPYIVIDISDGEDKIEAGYVKKRSEVQQLSVYLNASDSAEWTKLRGIGPVLSSRIIKFRNSLGGFYSVDQISEVYGLKDSVFERIRPFITHDSIEINKFALKQASVKEISSHPYISYKEAIAIYRFINDNTRIDSLEQLVEAGVISQVKLVKLKPYISVQN